MSEDPNKPALRSDVNEAACTAVAVAGGAALYQGMAIVGALAEARLLDPLAVAKWADFFAANLPPNTPPDARGGMQAGIAGFAASLRSMATMPAGAGRA